MRLPTIRDACSPVRAVTITGAIVADSVNRLVTGLPNECSVANLLRTHLIFRANNGTILARNKLQQRAACVLAGADSFV